jgi:putative NADH-flavin reductase
MNLLVIGAGGRTGRLVCEQALARGHSVTALVRHAIELGRARVVVGDPVHAPIVADEDVVISCLGHRSDDNPYLLREAATAVLTAGARRYLVVSQGLLFPENSPIFWVLRKIFARQLRDSAAMEEVVKASHTDWTIVRPPRLTDGTAKRGYRAVQNARPPGGWSMHRVDLATFLVDEAERNEHEREIVGVA